MLHPIAIGHEQRTIDRVVDHLEHAVSVWGSDRVCLGGDFTTRLWQAMPPPPEPKDGLMPPGLAPAPASRASRARSTTPRSSPPCVRAAGTTRRSTR